MVLFNKLENKLPTKGSSGLGTGLDWRISWCRHRQYTMHHYTYIHKWEGIEGRWLWLWCDSETGLNSSSLQETRGESGSGRKEDIRTGLGTTGGRGKHAFSLHNNNKMRCDRTPKDQPSNPDIQLREREREREREKADWLIGSLRIHIQIPSRSTHTLRILGEFAKLLIHKSELYLFFEYPIYSYFPVLNAGTYIHTYIILNTLFKFRFSLWNV
jgi:hypothetical protein